MNSKQRLTETPQSSTVFSLALKALLPRPAWDQLCVGVSSDTDDCNYTKWKRETKQNQIRQKQQRRVEPRAVAGLLLPKRWTCTLPRAPTHSHALDLGLSSPRARRVRRRQAALRVNAGPGGGGSAAVWGHPSRPQRFNSSSPASPPFSASLRPSPRGGSSADVCHGCTAKRISAIGLDGPSLAAHPDELASRG